MSNASLKEQLQAVASQLSTNNSLEQTTKNASTAITKPSPTPPRKAHPPTQMGAKNKKPKPKWLDYVQYGVELLKTYFPGGFKEMNQMAPLKKGIKQDLIKRLSMIETIVTEDKACMVKSLAYYVNTAAYHRVVVEGAMRIDLDGSAAGLVSAEEAKYSIERQQAKLQAKQAAATNNIKVLEKEI